MSARRKLAFVLAGVATLAFAAVMLLAPTGHGLGLWTDDLGATAAAAAAGLACLRASGPSAPRARRGWRLLGAGCLSWAAGNAVWAYHELVLAREVPFPSLADVGYLGFVPLVLGGVLALGPTFRQIGTTKRLADVALVTVALGGVAWIVVLGPVARANDALLQRVLALAYPVGDVLILAAVLSMGALLSTRRRSLPLLVVGLVLFAVSDVAFAYTTAAGTYASGSLVSVGWFSGFVAIALAARPVTPPLEVGALGAPTAWHGAVIHLPVVAVGAVAAAQGLGDGQVHTGTIWLILLVGALNIVRHSAASRQNRLLTDALEHQLEHLRAEQARSSGLIDGARDPYVEVDQTGAIRVWNDPAVRVFGWSRDEALGRRVVDLLIPARNQASHLERLHRFLLTSDPTVFTGVDDLVLRRADGSEVPIDVTIWHTGDGEDFRMHAFFRDISRQRAEAEALAVSERRWRALVRHASDITLLLDADGAIADEVPTTRSLLGYADGANSGRHFAELLHPSDVERVAEAFDRVRATPGHQERARFRVLRVDASWAHIEAIATNLLDEPAVGGIVCNLRDVTDQQRAEAELRRQARRDPLTGLPNRNHLTEALAEACRTDEGAAALLLMDLDGFKDINDGLGHDMGDRLLVELGRRLRNATRTDDVVARLGGDEFAVLVGHLDEVGNAVRIARHLTEVIQEPVRLDEVTLQVGVSIGIADCAPGDDPLAVLQRADVAMYRAKRQHCGHAVFGADDDEERRNSVKVAADLRQAIDHGDLVVHYQPKIELATGLVDSVEALVRWQHPERGLLPPDEFIALAERTGLIRDLTTQVLQLALQQCATWRAEGLDLPVAVNLSPRALGQIDLVSRVRSALEQTGLPASRLTLEVTESAFPENTRLLSATLRELGDLGVRISVDDFGTGWSSLSKLKELPVQELKIDKSFVFALADDDTDHSIVRSILDLARSLGLTVVAEGVETEEVRQLLVRLGCPLAQGYLFSRPIPGPRLTGWILGRGPTPVADRSSASRPR